MFGSFIELVKDIVGNKYPAIVQNSAEIQSALSVAKGLNISAAALELLQESAAEGVDTVNIAKQSALSALSDKQNTAAATIDTAPFAAVSMVAANQRRS